VFDKEFIGFKKVISDLQQPKKILTKDEEADEIVRRLATHPPNPLNDFRNIVLPMIRIVMPALIAQEILGVQPMQGINEIKKKEDKNE
jgi:hypothetical protein